MLQRLATYCDEEVDLAIGSCLSLLEPTLIIILGCAVATIVGGILIPLYTAIGNIK
jgi:type II secretory pathway component PulF